jgi:hypothetical protein
MKKIVAGLIQKMNYELIKTGKNDPRFVDFEALHHSIWDLVKAHTMTSKERIYGLIEAVKYISKHKIEGDFVECGVWKGGSMMAIARTLLSLGEASRKLLLYDTFEGMSEPGKEDVDFKNLDAKRQLEKSDKNSHVWAYSPLENVQKNIASTKYPQNKILYIKGKVEDTIPATLPDEIALLRLDTDWYESTKHELIHLFPRLQKGGVLIIDDYGFWKGARKAVDEYLEENNVRILLTRMDNTGRIAIKQ